ncbi:hypothetical protein So717_28020 [Roseobacter cerasinus]|uniref:UDP-N-acetylglucosamine 2-epimerase domain-containing protein n=2 Tax=Roseobacter cerasinus TaxID=2602289 RepID=A0A640VSP9_9RHOB|nr:hypothetical protein So717_28020 [Roseobacter cerasinus]
MACYGGGHVQSLIPIAQALLERQDIELEVIGFTTARAAFERAGVPAAGYCCLLDETDQKWIDLARQYAPSAAHPDITDDENLAYHAIGLRDLAEDSGQTVALEQFEQLGRKCFMPQHSFERFLKRTCPNLVIASSSPRSELAMIKAAKRLKIESLAISDLFLQAEAEYICAPDYAENVSVLSGYVRDFLISKGCQSRIWVTGNPAFDSLAKARSEKLRRKRRSELGLQDTDSLVLWVCQSSAVSILGKPFANPVHILEMLQNLARQAPGTHILIRQHPNKKILDESQIGRALQPPSRWTIEDCLAACDCVLQETSTVGLQAALLGRPVVTINADGYPPYADLGLATDVPTIDAALDVLQHPTKPDLSRLGAPDIGRATDHVLKTIDGILENLPNIEAAE